MKIILRYRWRIFKIKIWKKRAFLALALVKLAGKVSEDAVVKFAFMYVHSNYNKFQDWSDEREIEND